MAKLVWLASYPKSGNTWFRALLTNYQRDASAPSSVNDLAVTPVAGTRPHFDRLLNVDSSDLAPDEYDNYRPHVYRTIADEAMERAFLKVHDAYVVVPSGEALFPADVTESAVYVVRDPRDVALSFAHHEGITPKAAIAKMNDSATALASDERGLTAQLRQRLLTWSDHVKSWTRQTAFPVHVIRYEDMLERPRESFGAALEFLGFDVDGGRLDRSISHSAFSELQKQEMASGFGEALPGRQFFRRGESGAWRNELGADEVAAIETAHGEVMRDLGYDGFRGGR